MYHQNQVVFAKNTYYILLRKKLSSGKGQVDSFSSWSFHYPS